MKFRNIDIWMVRYLDGNVASFESAIRFRNRFINGFITAILKKSTFPKNPIGAQKSSE